VFSNTLNDGTESKTNYHVTVVHCIGSTPLQKKTNHKSRTPNPLTWNQICAQAKKADS